MSNSNSDDDDDSSVEGPQVRVSLQLASHIQDASLRVSSNAPIAVPADIGPKGLTAVVNHLLGRKSSAVSKQNDDEDDNSDMEEDDDQERLLPHLNFEFIMQGTKNKLLRKGVEKEARQHGVSLEEAVVITYFPASNAPRFSSEAEPLPDWISCLSTTISTRFKQTLVVSGCYDGSMHLYRRQKTASREDISDVLSKVDYKAVASGPIKAVAATSKFHEPNNENESKILMAIASMDQTLHLYTYDESKGDLSLYGECVPTDTHMPTAAICSLDFSSAISNPVLASGDGAGNVSIWNVQSYDDETTQVESKKHKPSSSNKTKKSTKRTISAAHTLEKSHSQQVSGMSWGNHYHHHSRNGHSTPSDYLITGSWDHSLKLWHVEKQNCLLTFNGSRVVSCLDTSYYTEGVVATGHPDCTIRMWDIRVSNTTENTTTGVLADTTFRPSHKAWVSSVQWNPHDAYQLASTSHDGTVKLWDIRSSLPLHTVKAFGKEDKALCLAWEYNDTDDGEEQIMKRVRMVVGGTDCVLKQVEF